MGEDFQVNLDKKLLGARIQHKLNYFRIPKITFENDRNYIVKHLVKSGVPNSSLTASVWENVAEKPESGASNCYKVSNDGLLGTKQIKNPESVFSDSYRVSSDGKLGTSQDKPKHKDKRRNIEVCDEWRKRFVTLQDFLFSPDRVGENDTTLKRASSFSSLRDELYLKNNGLEPVIYDTKYQKESTTSKEQTSLPQSQLIESCMISESGIEEDLEKLAISSDYLNDFERTDESSYSSDESLQNNKTSKSKSLSLVAQRNSVISEYPIMDTDWSDHESNIVHEATNDKYMKRSSTTSSFERFNNDELEGSKKLKGFTTSKDPKVLQLTAINETDAKLSPKDEILEVKSISVTQPEPESIVMSEDIYQKFRSALLRKPIPDFLCCLYYDESVNKICIDVKENFKEKAEEFLAKTNAELFRNKLIEVEETGGFNLAMDDLCAKKGTKEDYSKSNYQKPMMIQSGCKISIKLNSTILSGTLACFMRNTNTNQLFGITVKHIFYLKDTGLNNMTGNMLKNVDIYSQQSKQVCLSTKFYGIISDPYERFQNNRSISLNKIENGESSNSEPKPNSQVPKQPDNNNSLDTTKELYGNDVQNLKTLSQTKTLDPVQTTNDEVENPESQNESSVLIPEEHIVDIAVFPISQDVEVKHNLSTAYQTSEGKYIEYKLFTEKNMNGKEIQACVPISKENPNGIVYGTIVASSVEKLCNSKGMGNGFVIVPNDGSFFIEGNSGCLITERITGAATEIEAYGMLMSIGKYKGHQKAAFCTRLNASVEAIRSVKDWNIDLTFDNTNSGYNVDNKKSSSDFEMEIKHKSNKPKSSHNNAGQEPNEKPNSLNENIEEQRIKTFKNGITLSFQTYLRRALYYT